YLNFNIIQRKSQEVFAFYILLVYNPFIHYIGDNSHEGTPKRLWSGT
ncbi:unnamed protein product, partial [marine sediment metagenome]